MKNSFVQIQNAQDHVRTRLFSILVFLPCRIFRRKIAGKSGKLPALDIIIQSLLYLVISFYGNIEKKTSLDD